MSYDTDKKKIIVKATKHALNIENIMRSEGGRNYMNSLLQYCGVNEIMFDKDASQHSFNTGLRAVGVHIQNELKEASPGFYIKMIEENINE